MISNLDIGSLGHEKHLQPKAIQKGDKESEKGNLFMERDLANSVPIKRFDAAHLSDITKAVAPVQLWM